MLEAIALLAPSLVALKFYNHLHQNKLDARMLVMSYGIFVITINLCIYAATLYLLGHEAVVFTDACFVKYLLVAALLALIVPFVVNLAESTVSVKVVRSDEKA